MCRAGRFYGYGPYAAGAGAFPAAADEKAALRREAEQLRGALRRIDERLAALVDEEEPRTVT